MGLPVTAWKDLERRVARALGGQRRGQTGPDGWAAGSDDNGTTPFAIECKRTTRYQLRHTWIEQARRNARHDGRPWLLVIAEHNDRQPIAVLGFWQLVDICQKAGLIPTPFVVEDSMDEEVALPLARLPHHSEPPPA
jgi:hypothetical protein